jgi:hypothetical protein
MMNGKNIEILLNRSTSSKTFQSQYFFLSIKFIHRSKMSYAQPTIQIVTQKLFKRPLKDVYGFEKRKKENSKLTITFLNSLTLFAYFHSLDIIPRTSCHHLSHTRNRKAFAVFYTRFFSSAAVCAGFMLHNLFDHRAYSAIFGA